MRILDIECIGFRNLVSQKISFDKRICFINGKNAQGKTSLLEAIYLLSQKNSFRTSKTRELISWDSESSKVFANLDLDDLRFNLAYEINQNKREVFLNNKKVEQAKNFYGKVPIIAFTPENLALVQGPALGRRNYLDRLLVLLDENYLDFLVSYQRALKQKNALLKQEESKEELKVKLSIWDEILSNSAFEILRRRKNLISDLSEFISGIQSSIVLKQDKISDKRISILYKSNLLKEDRPLPSANEIKKLLSENLEKDLRSKRSSLGIQNDDFEVFLDIERGKKRARDFSSQGQARSLSLSLIFSAVDYLELKTKKRAIILLDDVESELDPERKKALEALILEKQNQIFISSAAQSTFFLNHREDVMQLEFSAGFASSRK